MCSATASTVSSSGFLSDRVKTTTIASCSASYSSCHLTRGFHVGIQPSHQSVVNTTSTNLPFNAAKVAHLADVTGIGGYPAAFPAGHGGLRHV